MHSINGIIFKFKQKYKNYKTIPQSKADILKFQALISKLNPGKNYRLPSDYVRFMLEVGPFAVDYELTYDTIASVKHSIYDYNVWMELVTTNEFVEDEDQVENPGRIENDPKIKYRWYDEGWIPICIDNGDCICIDLNPSPQGKVGQVIKMYHDWGRREVLADSFNEFISSAEYIESVDRLLKNSPEALIKPLTEAEEMQSDYGTRFKKIQEIKRKSANGEYDDLKADKKLVNEFKNSPVDKDKVNSAYDDIHKHYNIEPSKEEIAKALNEMKNKKASNDSKNIAQNFLNTLQKANINKNALAGAGGYIIAYAICKSKGLPVSKINIFKNFKIFFTTNPFKGFGNFVVFASAFICLYNVIKSGKKILDVIKETPPSVISDAKDATNKLSKHVDTNKAEAEISNTMKSLNQKTRKRNIQEFDDLINKGASSAYKKYMSQVTKAYRSKDHKKLGEILYSANKDKNISHDEKMSLHNSIQAYIHTLDHDKNFKKKMTTPQSDKDLFDEIIEL